MAENNPIVSSGAFDFGDYVSGGNVFTTEGTTGDTDARGSISGTYVQNILRASDPIDEVPEGGGQPIKVTPPPEVSQALYEIDFNRKLFGANLDVVNTLQDIEFRQGFSGINTPVLNIAYLTLWKRGNAPTAGEKVSTEVVDANSTEFRIDKSTGTYGKLENSVFGQGAILDPQNVIFTGQGVQGSFESSPIYRFPEWTVRAPDAVENKTTSAIQTPSSQFLPPGAGADRGITLGSFESTIRLEDVLPPEFSLSDGFFQPLSILNDFFQINSKPEIKPNRLLALSKAKIRLEEEKAKESPSTEMVRYYEDTIKQLEATTDEQFVADNDLPPDPRLEKAQPLPPLDGDVRKADVSWTTPPGSLLNKTGTPTEKVEGIWQFLFNPQTLERSFGPEYQFASTWGVPDGQPAHYSGHKNQELRFRDIILNGFVFGKRVESLVKGLEELTHVEKDSGQQSPPVLEFVWGKKVFGPCIMEDISITEQKWDGGELVDATLSFTLKKIPEWVVNDEYINIFNPVGQPLQKIIIETVEETTAPEGDSTDTTESSQDGGIKSDEKASPSCKKVINDYLGKYNTALRNTVNELNNVRKGGNKGIAKREKVLQDSISALNTVISNFHKVGAGIIKTDETEAVKTILKDSFNSFNQSIMNGLVNSLSTKQQYVIVENKDTKEYVVNKYVTGVLIESIKSTASGLKKWCKEAQIASTINVLNSVSKSTRVGYDDIDSSINDKICAPLSSVKESVMSSVATRGTNPNSKKVIVVSEAKKKLSDIRDTLNKISKELSAITQRLGSTSNTGGSRKYIGEASRKMSNLVSKFRGASFTASIYEPIYKNGSIYDFKSMSGVKNIKIKCDSPGFVNPNWDKTYILASGIEMCQEKAKNIYDAVYSDVCSRK